jgi:hypothetical protein
MNIEVNEVYKTRKKHFVNYVYSIRIHISTLVFNLPVSSTTGTLLTGTQPFLSAFQQFQLQLE